MALVIVDPGRTGSGPTLRGLAAAFRDAGLPVVHIVAPEAPSDAAWELDRDLLDAGGVQTLGRAELAIALRGRSAFDGTPLDALLRGLGVDTVILGGPVPSARVSSSVVGGELRGYRVLLATDELAVALGAHLRAA
jgi:nicotinamidase-related amidase